MGRRSGKSIQERYVVVSGKLEKAFNIMKEMWHNAVVRAYNARMNQIQYKKKCHGRFGFDPLDRMITLDDIKMDMPFYCWLFGETGAKMTRDKDKRLCINEDSVALILKAVEEYRNSGEKKDIPVKPPVLGKASPVKKEFPFFRLAIVFLLVPGLLIAGLLALRFFAR